MTTASPANGAPDNSAVLSGLAVQTPGREGRRRKRGGGAETAMVPDADFRSYYGRQILKSPTWHRLDIAGYLFAGGMASGSAIMAALADVSDRPGLRRVGRIAAGVGVYASLVGLVHDLGRPERFINMLRVFKPTSPMSVGTYILSPFAGLATIAVAGEVTGKLPTITRLAGFGAAAVAPALATYTSVLIADTAVPSWHESYRELPFVFAGSAIAAGGGMGALFAPADEAAPARRMIVVGGASELVAAEIMEKRLGVIGEVFHDGRAGLLLKAAKSATAAGIVTAALGGRFPVLSRLSGLSALAGSVLTRFGIFETGEQSTKDPRYVVVPQRERLEREGRADPVTR